MTEQEKQLMARFIELQEREFCQSMSGLGGREFDDNLFRLKNATAQAAKEIEIEEKLKPKN